MTTRSETAIASGTIGETPSTGAVQFGRAIVIAFSMSASRLLALIGSVASQFQTIELIAPHASMTVTCGGAETTNFRVRLSVSRAIWRLSKS